MTTEKDYGAILTVEELGAEVKRIRDSGQPFAFDIETGYDGPDQKGVAKMPFHPNFKVVGISFSDNPDWARYVPFDHDEGPNVSKLAVARLFWNLLNTGMGVPHNAMFELQGMSRFFRENLWDDTFFGKAVRASQGLYPVRSDTMIEANMMQCYQPLNAGQGVGVGLKGLTKHIFGHQMTEFMDLFPEEESELGPGTPKSKRTTVRFNTRRVCPQVIEYGCEDSAWTFALHLKHYSEVAETLMFRTEILLLPVLCEMELEGLALDWDEYERQEAIVSAFKDALNEEIQAELSERMGELVKVNFNSPAQVQVLLYEKMGLPVQMNKKTKKPTTDEKAMTKLAKETDDPALLKILEWRGVAKLLSSYITKYLKELRYDPSGRARPSHNQLGAGTGRFSVDGVSYQQWPKPYHFELKNGQEMDLNYRNFLVAPDEYRIIGFDFSQVELRILAGMTNETDMLHAFASGIDIHKATASAMLKIPLEELTVKDRAKGKTLNFGIVYGLGADSLAETLGISLDEANELLEKYYEGFPKLRAWMDDRVLEGAAKWEVSTLFGRRFHIWEYDKAEWLSQKASREEGDERRKTLNWMRNERSKADRMCVNAPVQGGAADYIKLGMVRASRKIKELGWQGKVNMVMTIHDAIEFYVHESISTQDVITELNPMFSFPVQGLPEILAEWHEGKRWGEVVEIKLDANKIITGYEYTTKIDGVELHGEFSSMEEAYAWQENPPIPEKAPEPETETILLIEMSEFPEAEPWTAAKDFIYDHAEGELGEYPVWVQIGDQRKSLDITLKGRDWELEELRFILPSANIRTVELELAS